MAWQIRLGVAGASVETGERLDLAALRSLIPLVDGAPIRDRGELVGHVREPVLLSRERFAVAEISAEPFEAQLRTWERRDRLATAVGLWIHGRRVLTTASEGDPSSVYVAVASIDVVDLPRGPGCFLWSSEVAATGGGVLPSLEVSTSRPWRSRPAQRDNPLKDLRQRFARHASPGLRP